MAATNALPDSVFAKALAARKPLRIRAVLQDRHCVDPSVVEENRAPRLHRGQNQQQRLSDTSHKRLPGADDEIVSLVTLEGEGGVLGT